MRLVLTNIESTAMVAAQGRTGGQKFVVLGKKMLYDEATVEIGNENPNKDQCHACGCGTDIVRIIDNRVYFRCWNCGVEYSFYRRELTDKEEE